MSTTIRRILVIDDNPSIHEDFWKIFDGIAPNETGFDAASAELFGPVSNETGIAYELDFASQGQEGLEKVRAAITTQRPYAMAFVDIQMPPGWDGVETMARIWDIAPDLQMVVCTAYSSYCLRDIIKKVGRSDRFVVLKKPFDSIEVIQLANAFSEKWQLLNEVTERARKLEESQHRYRFLADATPGLLWTATANGNLDYLNQRWCDFTGLTVEQSKDWGWQSVVHPEDLPKCLKHWTHALRTGENYEIEYRMRRGSDGAYRWHLGRAVPMRTQQGDIIHWIGTCTDIDDKKQAEKELLHAYEDLEKRVVERTAELTRSERLLRTVLDVLPQRIVWKDREGRFLGANHQVIADCGMSGVIGKTDNEMPWREQADAFRADDRSVMESGESKLDLSERLTDSTGKTILVSTSKVPLRDDAGEILGVLCAYLDVTERERAAEALRKSEGRYRELINCQGEGVVYTDAELKFTFANPAAESLLGAWPGQLIAKSLLDFLDEKNKSIAQQQLKLRGMGEKSSYEIEIITTKGERRQVLITGTPQFDSAGRLCGMFAIFRDITQRKNAELALRESQHLLRAVLDNIPDPAWLKDSFGRYLVGNKPLAQICHRKLEDIVGNSAFEVFPPYAARVADGENKAVDCARAVRTEVYVRDNDGQNRWFDLIETPILNKNGQLVSTVGIARDITDRKQIEQALRESENRHRELLDSQDDGVVIVDAGQTFTFANPGMGRILGLPAEQLIGRNIREFLDGDQKKILDEQVELRKRGKKSSYEVEFIAAGGERRQVLIHSTPKVDQDGKFCGTFAVFRDITERKRTEEKLHLQTSALVAAANGIVITDPSGHILWVNPAFTRLTGYSGDEAIGKTPALLKSGAHNDDFYKNLWTTIRRGKVWEGEMVNRRKDGSTYIEEMTITPVMDEHGAVKNFVAVKQDISRRKRNEELLRAREEMFRALADNVPDAVVRFDKNLRFVYGNRALANDLKLELSEFLGKTSEELELPQQKQWTNEVRRVFETGEHRGFEFNWTGPEGICYRECRLVPEQSATGEVEFVLAVMRDVSEEKRAEHERQVMDLQLRQAQKMEAVGQLAAGIAHEINTPTQYVADNTRFLKDAFQDITTALLGYNTLIAAAKENAITPEVIAKAEATLKSTDLDYHCEQIPAAINETLEGVERVSKIVRAMKDFSHPGGREKTAANLNKAIDSTVTVARNEWKYVADMVLELDPNLPLVPCFLGEFNQAILNLVINASHTIGDVVRSNPGKKGQITVRSRRDGDYVEVSVSDTGAGIPELHRQRIFEPFFTTKDVGKGTGQGLTLVYSSVVKKHGGTVTFETEIGRGTTFFLRLPLVSKAPETAPAETPREPSGPRVLASP